MKRFHIIIIFIFLVSFTKAQNIIINGNAVSLDQDLTFPYWLDSATTLEAGNNVVSISALEFNIVPSNNGNSLVFIQTKIITSQETVPNGMTWKLEGVMLDSSVNSSSNNGNINVNVVGGEKPIALSQESSNSMNLGNAMIYCDSLQEDGYDNWVIPTLETLLFVSGGGGTTPGTRTTNWLHTTTPIQTSQFGGEDEYYTVNLTPGNLNNSTGSSSAYVRCVRYESIEVNNSNASNYNSISLSGHPLPTMFSDENPPTGQYNDGYQYYEAFSYCDTLVENGYDNWRLPTFKEFIYLINGGTDMTGLKNGTQLWTATYFAPSHQGGAPTLHTIATNGTINQGGAQYWGWNPNGNNLGNYSNQPRKCRCVR